MKTKILSSAGHSIRNTQYAIRHTQYAVRPPSQLHSIRNTQYAIRNPPKSTVWVVLRLHNTQYARRFASQSRPLNTQYAIRNTLCTPTAPAPPSHLYTQYAAQYAIRYPSHNLRCAIRSSVTQYAFTQYAAYTVVALSPPRTKGPHGRWPKRVVNQEI